MGWDTPTMAKGAAPPPTFRELSQKSYRVHFFTICILAA
jgi:hypothetical protein